MHHSRSRTIIAGDNPVDLEIGRRERFLEREFVESLSNDTVQVDKLRRL